MSLIEEALRRVQGPASPEIEKAPSSQPAGSQQKTASTPSAAAPAHSWPTAEPDAPKSKPRKETVRTFNPNWISFLVIAVLLGSAGSWFAQLAARKPAPLQPAAAPMAHSTLAPAQAPKKIPSANSAFVLSGVVIGEGESFAVIDGKILAVGETVEGAVIQEITANRVKLKLANGSEKILQVPR